MFDYFGTANASQFDIDPIPCKIRFLDIVAEYTRELY